MPENYHELDEVCSSLSNLQLILFYGRKIVVREQDEKLEKVLGTIENIKGQTLIIGNELSEQAK